MYHLIEPMHHDTWTVEEAATQVVLITKGGVFVICVLFLPKAEV